MTTNSAIVERELKKFSNIIEKSSIQFKQIIENFGYFYLPPWQPDIDLIEIKLAPIDHVNTFDLIQTDNQFLNKTVTVLLSICQEMQELSQDAEDNFYIPLILYELKKGENCEITPQEKFSKYLPLLDQVSCYIQHVERVSWNVILQLNALYSVQRDSANVHAGKAHFQVVFECLGKLLSTLIILDEILVQSTELKNHLNLYKTLVQSSLNDPSSFDINVKEVSSLDNLLKDIESKLFKKSILKGILGNLYKKCLTTISKNTSLQEEMVAVILGWSAQIDIAAENINCDVEKNIISVTALALCHQMIFDSRDRKITKELLGLFKKVPCITICISQVWLGERYIKSNFSSFYSTFDRRGIESLTNCRKNYLASKIQSINAEVQSANLKVMGWSLKMDVVLKKHTSNFNRQELSRLAALLQQGLVIASSLKYTTQSVIGLHTVTCQPMGKSCVISLCRAIEVIKAIEHSYSKCTKMLIETLPHLRQYSSYQILTLIKNTKIRVKNEKKLNTYYLDVLAALSLAEQALSGNATPKRRLLARISLSLATQNKIINDNDLSSLLQLLKHLELANDLQVKVKISTNTEFLFAHQIIFKFYLQDYFENFPSCCHRIHYLLSAFADSEMLLRRPKELPGCDTMLENIKEETEKTLKTQFLDKICKAVEIELRLNTHKHLQLECRNPFEKSLKFLYPLTQLKPLNVFGSYYIVKEYVEQYLERTFYSLTILAPHNCNTYEQMRNNAHSNLNLITVPSYLPSHTLEQGVDVLEIMRNINVFVQHYQYNLNQQFFVEIESSNKHLNTVSIRHIANSIRTHGTGIINTTVNFTYQFLKKKFHILSQFLYNEHIKSRLFKDLQYWKELKGTEKSFPYERAEKFNRGIRKLGLTEDGLSYLDQCRKLVTHIGNAIGYIRLVRSGGLHCISNATQFIPDLEKVPRFTELCQDKNISSDTLEAATILDNVTSNLTSHFHQETDYFKILVDVFSILREAKNSHLKYFYVLVPALTINFIEYFLSAKSHLHKKVKSKLLSFTDDGFAIGLAYILKVLDQHSNFDSLYWWSGVRRKFDTEKDNVQNEVERQKGSDAKLRQTLSLTTSRLNEQQMEFDLLFYNISSAIVLFKGTYQGNRVPYSNID